jgi:hypothetical protein
VASADYTKQVTKSYRLQHAIAARMVELLQSLFIVVNLEEPYVRLHADERMNSLTARASRQHQDQIARVLVLVDTPDKAPAQPVGRDEQKQLVKGYRIKHMHGAATVELLRSLFLVVNYRVAYARFAYDPRGQMLITIAPEKYQRQIAQVLELLDTPATPAKAGGKEVVVEQVRVVPIRHIEGNQILAKLRSHFVVVNHEQADARFGFDQRTHALVVIAPEKLHARILERIAVLDQPMEGQANECFSTREDSTITLHPEAAAFGYFSSAE